MTKTMERPATQMVVRPSTYATILVHAEPGLASSHRVEAAARLARTLDARLIGLGAETFDPGPYSAGAFMSYGGAELVGLVQEQITKNIAAAETAFLSGVAGFRGVGQGMLLHLSARPLPDASMNRSARASEPRASMATSAPTRTNDAPRSR